MKYTANPVEVEAFKISRIFVQLACAERCTVWCGGQEVNVVCGEPEFAHTPEAAKGDVAMDHDYVKGSWDAEGLGIELEGGRIVVATPEMTSRMTPVVGDYWVVQSDGYAYLNPKNVFERKYSPSAMSIQITGVFSS